MKTLKKICKLTGDLCKPCKCKDVDFMLINGKAFFKDTITKTPEGRDLLVRAWLKYCGVPDDVYFKNVYKTLEKELR